MKVSTGFFLGVILILILCGQGNATPYNFIQHYDDAGITISGTFNVVNDTFWNDAPGYVANSTSTTALLSDLSLSITFSGTPLFNLSDYTLNSWNIFLATPAFPTTYKVGDDVFPNGRAEGFYADYNSSDGSFLQIIVRLDYDYIFDPITHWPIISPVTGEWMKDYEHPWYGKIAGSSLGSISTQELMTVTPAGATPTPTPEPATLVLCSLGMAGLACIRKK